MEGTTLRVLGAAFATVPATNPDSTALLAMATALRADLDLVTLKPPHLAYQGRIGEARLFRVPVQGTPAEQRAGFARAVRRQVESEPYDIVHVREPVAGVALESHRRAMGFRLVYECGGFADESEGRGVVREWLNAHQRCLQLADLVVVGSEAAARALRSPTLTGKAAVVAPGVDIDAFDRWPSAPSAELRLLFLGPFSADRELPTLLAAVRQVAERVPLRVLLAGERSPDRRAQMRRLVENFGVSRVIAVRGEPHATAVPRLIAACDVGVVTASSVPRFQEHGALPEPLLEYLACRKAVVVAAVPGVAEVVRDEQEGLLYAPSDDESLAEAILALAANATLRERLASNGYTRVRQHFSSGARRRRIAEVYAMLAPGSQRYDAWEDAFDEGAGALLAASSSVLYALEELQTTRTVQQIAAPAHAEAAKDPSGE